MVANVAHQESPPELGRLSQLFIRRDTCKRLPPDSIGNDGHVFARQAQTQQVLLESLGDSHHSGAAAVKEPLDTPQQAEQAAARHHPNRAGGVWPDILEVENQWRSMPPVRRQGGQARRQGRYRQQRIGPALEDSAPSCGKHKGRVGERTPQGSRAQGAEYRHAEDSKTFRRPFLLRRTPAEREAQARGVVGPPGDHGYVVAAARQALGQVPGSPAGGHGFGREVLGENQDSHASRSATSIGSAVSRAPARPGSPSRGA